MLSITSVFSQTVFTSTGSGNWSSSFTSSGSGTPLVYKILSSHTINVNVSGTSAIDSIIISGTLNFNNGKKVDLSSTGIIVLNSGATITGGNGGSKFRFPNGVTIVGTFSETGPSYADATTGSNFITGFLPVEWLNVDVSRTENTYTVNWSTAEELNSDYFDIQMSTDGVIWNSIRLVDSRSLDGNSNSILNYSESLYVQSNSQYKFVRIKQVDFDGLFDYSIILKLPSLSTPSLSVNYLSNGKIRIVNSNNSTSAFAITNVAGQEIATYSIDTSIEIQLPPNQIYIITSQSGFVQKVML